MVNDTIFLTGNLYLMLNRILSVPALLKKTAEPEAPMACIGAETPPAETPRLGALEALWGVGRYGPGSGELDDMLLDAPGFGVKTPSPIGFLGADPVLALAARNRFGTQVRLAEWRHPCADRSMDLLPDFPVATCDLDRPHGFDTGSLSSLISQDAMAFADHKSGLSTQVFRLLEPGGYWIILDLLRNGDSVSEAAFGSAWAEPKLPTPEMLESVLQTSGFTIAERLDASPLLVRAVNNGFKHLGDVVQDISSHHSGPKLMLMLQEITWEASSWKARLEALEEEELSAVLWTLQKPASSPDLAAQDKAEGAEEAKQEETAEAV